MQRGTQPPQAELCLTQKDKALKQQVSIPTLKDITQRQEINPNMFSVNITQRILQKAHTIVEHTLKSLEMAPLLTKNPMLVLSTGTAMSLSRVPLRLAKEQQMKQPSLRLS